MRTLVVRDDRIGDLVLTLPAIEALARGGDEITLLASAANADVVVDDPRIARVVVLPERGWPRLRGFAGLLRRGRFDRAFFFRSRWPLGWIAALFRVPSRVGPLANVDGLSYTVRPRQHRSICDRSEADYSLELVRLAGAGAPDASEAGGGEPRTRLHVPEVLRERARRWIGSELGAAASARPLVAIHPGSGGSSRNWSAAHYRSLVRELARAGDVVPIVTAAPAEAALAKEVAAGATPAALVHVGWAGALAHAALLAEMSVVVSGSTGTMHLAAAVGVPTVSLFAPIRASSPARWGARSPDARFLIPPVPDCERCIGLECPWWDCMDRIGVDRVVSAVREALRRPTSGG